MTMKPEHDYFESDGVSPIEQYKKMLIMEKIQMKNDLQRGFYKY